MKRLPFALLFLGSTAAILLASPLTGLAAINHNYLVSDTEMERVDSMGLGDIQTFLDQRGVLGTRFFDDVDGVTKTSAEIITRVASTYQLSPRFLLTLLQREQSLVESKSITARQTDWAVGYAVCDDCDRDHPLVAAYKGFAQQLEGASKRIRNFYLNDLANTGKTQTGYGPGLTKIVDGAPVTPQNNATAVLYTYTPHLNGNLNFARIWKRWFSREIPDGTVIRTEDGAFWLINDGTRRKFANTSALVSRANMKDAVQLPLAVIEDYEEGMEIRYANYSLFHGPDGTNYLLDGDTIRPIASQEVFRQIGFNPLELEDVSVEELASFVPGTPITTATLYPTGGLLQLKNTGGVYWVKDGIKHPIPAKEIMTARFPKKKLTPVSADALDDFTPGEPLLFADGMLIGATGDPTVYVVSRGERRPITSEDAFKAVGWNFKNVIWASPAVIELHPLGAPIETPQEEPDVQTASTPSL